MPAPGPVTLEWYEWETLIEAVVAVTGRSRSPLAYERRRVVGRLLDQIAPKPPARSEVTP